MKRNDIVAAPQLVKFQKAVAMWRDDNVGGFDDFYRFITVPSAERDEFLARFPFVASFMGSVMVETVRCVNNL